MTEFNPSCCANVHLVMHHSISAPAMYSSLREGPGSESNRVMWIIAAGARPKSLRDFSSANSKLIFGTGCIWMHNCVQTSRFDELSKCRVDKFDRKQLKCDSLENAVDSKN